MDPSRHRSPSAPVAPWFGAALRGVWNTAVPALLGAAALCACESGPQGYAAPGTTGVGGAGPSDGAGWGDTGVEQPGRAGDLCRAWRWHGAEPPVELQCMGHDRSWRCRCDDAAWEESPDGTCGEALRSVCGATEDDMAVCMSRHEGDGAAACRPTAEGWECRCADGTLRATPAAEATCDDAAFGVCAAGCGSGGDSCVPGPRAGTWSCACAWYGAERQVDAGTCDQALHDGCDPTAGCNGWGGYCDKVTAGTFGFSCHCLDGTGGFVTPAAMGGQDDCVVAREKVCGPDHAPDGLACEASAADHWGRCIALPPFDAPTRWSCSCGRSSDSGGGASGSGGAGTPAASCEQALETCLL